MNRKRVPDSYIWPSLEACEVHSMSMEFFAWPWAEGFFGPDTRKFLYSHLAGALTFIPLRHDGGPLPAHRVRKAGHDPRRSATPPGRS